MSVVYTRIGGQLVAETRNGVCTQYISDTNGNLVGEINEQGEVTYRCEYWPFGEVREETGTKRSEWGFAGLLGCMTDNPSSIYMRARIYQPEYARWQTVDPLWPDQSAYIYADANPVSRIDPSGKQYWDYGLPTRDRNGRLLLPPSRDYLANCCIAMKFNNRDPSFLLWMYAQFHSRGPWDFKQNAGVQFEDAGNYHYGFITCCAGMTLDEAMKAAGDAQKRSNTSCKQWDKPPLYGDDPKDYRWIKEGYENCQKWKIELKRKCRGYGLPITPFG